MTGANKLDGANQSDPPGIVRVDRRVRPRAWYGPKVDACITDERKTKRARLQPWDTEHYSVPLFELPKAADYECADCIGMREHGCYCQAMGALRPGGP
jgi:hypothetical protein